MILDFQEYWSERIQAGSNAVKDGCAKLTKLDPKDPSFDKKYAGVAKLMEANASDIDNFNRALLAAEENRIKDESNHVEEEKTKQLAKANARHDIIEILKLLGSLLIGGAGLLLKWRAVDRVTEKEGGDDPEPIMGMADRSIVTEAMKDSRIDNIMNFFRF